VLPRATVSAATQPAIERTKQPCLARALAAEAPASHQSKGPTRDETTRQKHCARWNSAVRCRGAASDNGSPAPATRQSNHGSTPLSQRMARYDAIQQRRRAPPDELTLLSRPVYLLTTTPSLPTHYTTHPVGTHHHHHHHELASCTGSQTTPDLPSQRTSTSAEPWEPREAQCSAMLDSTRACVRVGVCVITEEAPRAWAWRRHDPRPTPSEAMTWVLFALVRRRLHLRWHTGWAGLGWRAGLAGGWPGWLVGGAWVGDGRSVGRSYVCLERVIDMMRRGTTRHDTRKSVSLVLVPAPVGWSEGKEEARGKSKCWVTLA
jgi:hypothetical protein